LSRITWGSPAFARASASSGGMFRVAALFLPDLFQLLRGLEGAVGPAGLDQFLGVLLVKLEPLGLAVGGVRPPDVRPLVVVEAEPPEHRQDAFLGALDVAGPVGVLDADDEAPPVLSRPDVVKEGDVGGAHVGVAGGGGGDAGRHHAAHSIPGRLDS